MTKIYEASRLRKYTDGVVGNEYRLVQVGDETFNCFVDKNGKIWVPQPTNIITKALIEEWMDGNLSMGITKEGEVIWQQRAEKFPQSELVEATPNV